MSTVQSYEVSPPDCEIGNEKAVPWGINPYRLSGYPICCDAHETDRLPHWDGFVSGVMEKVKSLWTLLMESAMLSVLTPKHRSLIQTRRVTPRPDL